MAFAFKCLRCLMAALGACVMTLRPGLAQEVHEYVLSNGLKVILRENHNAPVIELNVVYRVGSKYETAGITGISHLLEHMMFKTTKNLPLGEFDKQLKAVGADNNAYTWLDQTVYYESIAADKIDVALGLEAERMRNLSVLPEDHQFEMTVVRNELEQRDDSPSSLLYEQLQSVAFLAHPYKIPTIGWKDDVESIRTEEIKAYYDRFYQPDNAFICAVGDFEPDALLEKIKSHFEQVPSGHVKLPRIGKEPPQLGERRFEIRRAGQVDYLLSAWHIPATTDPDSYSLVVLGNILGQGRTSRLYKALVDGGMCASAGAWASNFGYADPFLFFTSAVMNPGVDPSKVEPVIYKEIDGIVQAGVTDQELARAKKQARVSFIYDKDSLDRQAGSLIDFELAGDWHNLDKYLPGIEAVTGADVQRVAAKYLTKDNRTVGTYLAIRPAGGETGAPAEQPGPAGPPHYRSLDSAAGRDRGLASPLPASLPKLPAATPQAPTPGASAPESPGEPYAAVTTLPNGLTVVVRENHSNTTVSVNGLIRAGRIDDPPDKPGVGSFAVQMLSSGTTKHSKQELAEIMEGAGLELGFMPGRESFSFGGRSLSEDFPLLLDMLAEQLLEPAFPETEVELTRQQIQSGLLASTDDTFDVGMTTARDALYGGENPFAGRVEGTKESVAAITRDDLALWQQKNVVPEGAILTIVGDVNAAAALAEVVKRLGGWQGNRPDRAKLLDLGGAFRNAGGQQQKVELPDKSNVSLQWMGPGPSKLGPDWARRTVANFILGGDFLSRLNERLRIKDGLTYWSFSWFNNSRAAGPFCVSAQVNPQNVDPAIAAANEELARFSADGPTEEELALAKDYLTGNFPVRLETNADIAGVLTDAVYLDRGVDYVRRYRTEIEAVTRQQVAEVAKQFMAPAKMLLVISGTVK